MPEIPLYGCRPEPLMSYLKALGVLRLVAEQKDCKTRGRWQNDVFTMSSDLDKDGLVCFFLKEYSPTPIVAPWAGGCGFFAKDNHQAVDEIATSRTSRLESYRRIVQLVRKTLLDEEKKADLAAATAKRMLGLLKGRKSGVSLPKEFKDGFTRAVASGRGVDVLSWLQQYNAELPDRFRKDVCQALQKQLKDGLLQRYRTSLPDAFIAWMDCVLVLRNEGQAFPPLLGTGGNDGRLDFTQNFMQRLCEIGITKNEANDLATKWLRNALFGEAAELSPSAVGQFNPGRVGGPNATQGMEGASLVNPWDFILMMEGTLLLAGSAVRRMGAGQPAKAAFPFTVVASTVGEAALSESDSSGARGETWLPLWSRTASLAELSQVFSEGRVELSGRQSRNGVDVARAIASVGVDRGLSSFTRFGFLKRSGKAYLASPLGRFEVRGNANVDLLRGLDRWLNRFRRACGGKNVPPRFASALRRLDAAVFDFCRYGGAPRFAEILCALGQIERQLSLVGDKPGKVGGYEVGPVPYLDPEWIDACDDGTAEFRIALALASIQGQDKVGPLRSNLEPVTVSARKPAWAERDKAVIWSSANLCRNLAAVLKRRMMDASRLGASGLPLAASYHAPLSDVVAFLDRRTDNRRIEELLWGAMLIRPQAHWPSPRAAPEAALPIPRAYALLKLLFLPENLAMRSQGGAGPPARPEPGILARLRAGHLHGATAIAARRLHASGFAPMPGPGPDGRQRLADFPKDLSPQRLGAALLIPIQNVQALQRCVLRPSQPAQEGQE